MFPTLIRRVAAGGKPRVPLPFNPYKTKKVWPPDFSKLSPQEQFRYEKRYKRRVKILSSRPQWNRIIKFAQLFGITFTVVYCVAFMDSDNPRDPFHIIREKVRQLLTPFQGALTPERGEGKPVPKAEEK